MIYYRGLQSQEHPELYKTYKNNWYAGYTVGFLSKLVISAGAGKAAKSTIKSVDKVNSIAQKSKNTEQYTPLYYGESTYRNLGERLADLRKKLNTQAAGGQDEIVVVMRQDQFDAEYSYEVIDEFPDAVNDVKILRILANSLRTTLSDVSVKFKRYSDLNE